MKFTKAKPTENFPVVRWVSENNIWEMGFLPVLFGIRVRAGKVGNGWVTIDYCAGANESFALILFATVAQILMSLPETVSEHQVEKLFPSFTVKPIDRDPTCWEELKELAARVERGEAIA